MAAEARGHAYGNDFFNYIEEGASRSARVIVPLIADLFRIESVLDVGCGCGIWLREWCNRGVTDVVGLDGAYVDDAQLVISTDKFMKCDLSQPISLKRRFDLVQSLEVGEHVAAERADVFVANLTTHSDLVLFSAAIPGQGGEFHVNERPYGYWRDKFAAEGFRTFDCLRPHIHRVANVEPWYRYNTLIFARAGAIDRARPELLVTEIPHDRPVPTWAPLSWRIRNGILAHLPKASVHRLAILKHKLIVMQRRRRPFSYLR